MKKSATKKAPSGLIDKLEIIYPTFGIKKQSDKKNFTKNSGFKMLIK
jgi:hypothetical protein